LRFPAQATYSLNGCGSKGGLSWLIFNSSLFSYTSIRASVVPAAINNISLKLQ
jgi:hypothetical protein